MNRAAGGTSQGYTILETMIFLAVSAAMFFSAMAFVGGKQNRTEFASAVRDLETSLNDIANDVSTGYYANITSTGQMLSCTPNNSANPVPVQLTATNTDAQGKNTGCIFIGKTVVFRPSNLSAGTYVVVPLVGRQFVSGDPSLGDVQSYADSGIKAVAPVGAGGPDAATNRQSAVMEIGCVFYGTTYLTPPATQPCINTPGSTRIDTISFMTQFHGTNSVTGDRESGSNQVNIVVPSTAPLLPRNLVAALTSVNGYTDSAAGGGPNITTNPKGGVYICIQSNGSNQHALLSMGGKNSRFSTSGAILSGGCS